MTLLTVFVGIIALSNLVLLAGIAFLAFGVKRLIDKSVRPAVSEAQSAIHNVNELVDNVEGRTERILDIGEETARKVSGTVVSTSDMIRSSITSPLISISSLFAGITEAVQACRRPARGGEVVKGE